MKKYRLEMLFGIDLRTLALFRVCLGLLVLHFFLTLGLDFKAFYTNEGVLPASLFLPQIKPFWQCSIFLINDSPAAVLILLALAGLSAAAFIVGYNTRWASFWMWFFLISLQVRNPYVIGGHDWMLRLLAFWAMFVPLGDKYAWDALPDNKKVKECSFATFALMMQVCYLYVFSAFFKSKNLDWMSGQGVLCALQIASVRTPFGHFLTQFPNFLSFITYATMILEAVGPFLFFSPIFNVFFRTSMLIAFTALQASLFVSLDLLNFPPTSITATIPFIPSEWWNALAKQKWSHKPSAFVLKILSRPVSLGHPRNLTSNEIYLRRILSCLALFFTLLVFSINIATTNQKFSIPQKLKSLSSALMLEQNWALFALPGHFANENYWFVIQGTLADGSKIDVLRKDAVDWDCPINYSKAYKNPRWKQYMTYGMSSATPNGSVLRQTLLKYLAGEWNRTHKTNSQIKKIEFYQLSETIRPKAGNRKYNILDTYTLNAN